jgi:hypothetical protein
MNRFDLLLLITQDLVSILYLKELMFLKKHHLNMFTRFALLP